ncbi:hypothetical protein HYH02_013133 [Chlamydomonas schloesseri]|uniref:Endonuclease/exonuclease/phosphatase domain-containing protein n=1 Tax=Chlamydomonas schloesseri TaxID=2026947 RepID=A0A835T5I4_9CHLO|nr:hypothetical protein HYH02_013133 [Chlamydomonas schloesseri]|eukprot:KAG2432065.1 hypothetical protein HYH02_013133 [Chlamydomonas schloesseri]
MEESERQAKRPRLEVATSAVAPSCVGPSATPSTAAPLTAELHAERQRRLGAGPPARQTGSEAALGAAVPAAVRQQAEGTAGSTGTLRRNEAGLPGVSGLPAAADTRGHASTSTPRASSSSGVSILTWNVWFEESVALMERMAAVGAAIEAEGYPDLLLFQEVTPHILLVFSQADWFRRYRCSPPLRDSEDGPYVPYFVLLLARRDSVVLPPPPDRWEFQLFTNTQMGRGLLYTRVVVGGRPLVVGTVHLESPVPGGGTSQQKKEQLAVALQLAEAAAGPAGDALVAGDFNWFEDRMGPMALPPRWVDAWAALRPREPGFTYDARHNEMLNPRYTGSRIDRVAVRLCSAGPGGRGWRLDDVKLLGLQAIPGVRAAAKGKKNTQIWPSDHFGILLRLTPALPAFSGAGRVLGDGDSGSGGAGPSYAVPAQGPDSRPAQAVGAAATWTAAIHDNPVAGGACGTVQELHAAAEGEGVRGVRPAGEKHGGPAGGRPEAAGAATAAAATCTTGGGRPAAAKRTLAECVDLTFDDD